MRSDLFIWSKNDILNICTSFIRRSDSRKRFANMFDYNSHTPRSLLQFCIRAQANFWLIMNNEYRDAISRSTLQMFRSPDIPPYCPAMSYDVDKSRHRDVTWFNQRSRDCKRPDFDWVVLILRCDKAHSAISGPLVCNYNVERYVHKLTKRVS